MVIEYDTGPKEYKATEFTRINSTELRIRTKRRQTMLRERTANRSTSKRLQSLIEAELKRQNLTDQEAAREARLPANAFRALRYGHRPSVDRAHELCNALSISMVIGDESTTPTAARAA